MEVHAEIARALFQRLSLLKEFGGVFVKGITIPDK